VSVVRADTAASNRCPNVQNPLMEEAANIRLESGKPLHVKQFTPLGDIARPTGRVSPRLAR